MKKSSSERPLEEDSLFKLMISLRNLVLRALSGGGLGEGFLIKIDHFLKESCPQSSGGGFLIQIDDFLKESCAQSPLWRRSGRGIPY